MSENKTSKNEKAAKMTIEDIINRQSDPENTLSLDGLIAILNSPRIAGFEKAMKKRAFSLNDISFLHTLWPKVITFKEWGKSWKALEEWEQKDGPKEIRIQF